MAHRLDGADLDLFGVPHHAAARLRCRVRVTLGCRRLMGASRAVSAETIS